jgi:hypothetical protein
MSMQACCMCLGSAAAAAAAAAVCGDPYCQFCPVDICHARHVFLGNYGFSSWCGATRSKSCLIVLCGRSLYPPRAHEQTNMLLLHIAAAAHCCCCLLLLCCRSVHLPLNGLPPLPRHATWRLAGPGLDCLTAVERECTTIALQNEALQHSYHLVCLPVIHLL